MGEDVPIAIDEVVKGTNVLLVVPLVHQKLTHLGHVQLVVLSDCPEPALLTQDILYPP